MLPPLQIAFHLRCMLWELFGCIGLNTNQECCPHGHVPNSKKLENLDEIQLSDRPIGGLHNGLGLNAQPGNRDESEKTGSANDCFFRSESRGFGFLGVANSRRCVGCEKLDPGVLSIRGDAQSLLGLF